MQSTSSSIAFKTCLSGFVLFDPIGPTHEVQGERSRAWSVSPGILVGRRNTPLSIAKVLATKAYYYHTWISKGQNWSEISQMVAKSFDFLIAVCHFTHKPIHSYKHDTQLCSVYLIAQQKSLVQHQIGNPFYQSFVLLRLLDSATRIL